MPIRKIDIYYEFFYIYIIDFNPIISYNEHMVLQIST